MKNIAILLYDASLMGGAENVAIALANELCQFHILSLISVFNENRKPFWTISNEVKYFVVCQKTVKIPLNLLKISKKIKKILQKEQIDVVLCITAGVIAPAVIAIHNLETKLIYCEHSNLKNVTYGKKHKIRQWIGANYSDWIVTLTKQDMMEFISKYKIENVSQIYNWYNHDINNTKYNLMSQKIITAGRFVKLKGYDNLVEIAKMVFKDFPHWQWDIYGDGEEFVSIQNKIIEYGLQDNLILKGKTNILSELYKEYALYVLTSKFEGLPMVLLEAQANHLPIVSFDCPTGPKEIVNNDISGYLVEPDDLTTMAGKIKILIADAELRERMSSYTMDDFEKFKKNNVISQWLSLIESISP